MGKKKAKTAGYTEKHPVNLAKRYILPPLDHFNLQTTNNKVHKEAWDKVLPNCTKGRSIGNIFGLAATNKEFVSRFNSQVLEFIVYNYSSIGDIILDPFCGGAEKGLIAAVHNRGYIGFEIRPEQKLINEQARTQFGVSPAHVQWILCSSEEMKGKLTPGKKFQLVFTCPPYGWLEQYSNIDGVKIQNIPRVFGKDFTNIQIVFFFA